MAAPSRVDNSISSSTRRSAIVSIATVAPQTDVSVKRRAGLSIGAANTSPSATAAANTVTHRLVVKGLIYNPEAGQVGYI
eukprot:20070-Heterococcus_DN1.PRE.1